VSTVEVLHKGFSGMPPLVFFTNGFFDFVMSLVKNTNDGKKKKGSDPGSLPFVSIRRT